MAQFSFTMTDAQIEKGIPSIKSRAAAIRADIHKLCVSILYRWSEDCAANVAANRAGQLLDAVDGAHKQKIVNWFSVYAGFSWDADENKFVYTSTTISSEKVLEAKKETAFDLTPDQKPVKFDLDDAIRQLIQRAERAASKASEDGAQVTVNDEHLSKLKAVLSS